MMMIHMRLPPPEAFLPPLPPLTGGRLPPPAEGRLDTGVFAPPTGRLDTGVFAPPTGRLLPPVTGRFWDEPLMPSWDAEWLSAPEAGLPDWAPLFPPTSGRAADTGRFVWADVPEDTGLPDWTPLFPPERGRGEDAGRFVWAPFTPPISGRFPPPA